MFRGIDDQRDSIFEPFMRPTMWGGDPFREFDRMFETLSSQRSFRSPIGSPSITSRNSNPRCRGIRIPISDNLGDPTQSSSTEVKIEELDEEESENEEVREAFRMSLQDGEQILS